MAIVLNTEAFEYAKQLIESGDVSEDDGDWSDHAPTTAEENKFFAENEIQEYGKWFLGIDVNEAKDSKDRYIFPFGNFFVVYRSGLEDAKYRAAQIDLLDIEDAADELIDIYDAQVVPQQLI